MVSVTPNRPTESHGRNWMYAVDAAGMAFILTVAMAALAILWLAY